MVGGQTTPMLRGSHVLTFVEYDPSATGNRLDTAEVEKLLLDTATSPLKAEPTQKELDRAKNYLIGTHALAHQRTKDRAFFLGWYESIGLGFEFDSEYPKRLAAVTLDDVKRVAAKYLKSHVVSIVQPIK